MKVTRKKISIGLIIVAILCGLNFVFGLLFSSSFYSVDQGMEIVLVSLPLAFLLSLLSGFFYRKNYLAWILAAISFFFVIAFIFIFKDLHVP